MCLDRVYLNGYVPKLQVAGQVVGFMTRHERGCEPVGLLVGEQVRAAGVQGPPGPVERVGLPAAVAVQPVLDAALAAVQGVTGQAPDVERDPSP